MVISVAAGMKNGCEAHSDTADLQRPLEYPRALGNLIPGRSTIAESASGEDIKHRSPACQISIPRASTLPQTEPAPGQELGDHIRLFLLDAAVIVATGLHQNRRVGNLPVFASTARVMSTISFIATAAADGAAPNQN
jgi:hypothetical protein